MWILSWFVLKGVIFQFFIDYYTYWADCTVDYISELTWLIVSFYHRSVLTMMRCIATKYQEEFCSSSLKPDSNSDWLLDTESYQFLIISGT